MRELLLRRGRILIASIGIVLIVISLLIDNNSLPTPEFGKPTVITDPIKLKNNHISQILDDGERMYVLNGHLGYVQIYDLKGVYQQTLLFYSHPNGIFQLAIDGTKLYVSDKHRNLYVFENGVFDSFLSQKDGVTIRELLDFNLSSDRYELHGASVWRVDGEQVVCVIERSFLQGLIQDFSIFPIWLITIIVFGLLGRFLKSKETLNVTGDGTKSLKK